MSEEYDDMVSHVLDAFNDWLDMSPAERSGYYDEFFDYWDMTPEEESLFWDLYRES